MPRTVTSIIALGAFLGALVISAPAGAQTQTPPPAMAQPPTAAPQTPPPMPSSSAPPPPRAQPMEAHPQGGGPVPPAAAPRTAAAPQSGQWTYTQQYGWIWMPYDQSYTHVADDSALAYEYVWYPGYGWSWVVAPWVLGLGVTPFWGPLGPVHFAWYAHPWFRMGVGHLHPYWGHGFAPGGWHGGWHGGGHRR